MLLINAQLRREAYSLKQCHFHKRRLTRSWRHPVPFKVWVGNHCEKNFEQLFYFNKISEPCTVPKYLRFFYKPTALISKKKCDPILKVPSFRGKTAKNSFPAE